MAWIESHQSLASHRKTMRLSRQLKISIPEAIGHLHCLWWWGLDNTPDGNLAGLDPLDIAMAGLWEGDADTFLGALIDAGFIDREEDHLAIHDWWEFAGKFIDRRRQDAERKRTARQQETSPSDAGNGTGKPQKDVQRTSEGHPTDVLRTVPNPTEQHRSNTSSNNGGGKNYSAREDFAAASSNGKPRAAPAAAIQEKTEGVFAACPHLERTAATERALRAVLVRNPDVDAVGQAQETMRWGTKHESAGGRVDNWWNLFLKNLKQLAAGEATLTPAPKPPPETQFWEPPPEELARIAERDRLMQEQGRARGHG